MKNILILILKNGDATGELFQILSQKGFNSSVLIAKSLKHYKLYEFYQKKKKSMI